MKFKNILTSFALALAIAVPSVSSAMTSDQVKNSIGSITVLLDIAQSMVGSAISSNIPKGALTSGSDVSNDVNNDGEVDSEDLKYIYDRLFSSTSTPGYFAADIDGDGRVDHKDFFQLKAYFNSIGDYVNAYDTETIGSGWTTVPKDGVVDQKDVGSTMFAAAVYEQDNAHYSVYFDHNEDQEVDSADVDFIESIVASIEAAPDMTPEVDSVSPRQNNEGEETTVSIKGENLDGVLAVILIDEKAHSHIYEELDVDSNEIVVTLPSYLPAGNYTVHLLADGGGAMVQADDTYKVVSNAAPQAPVVTISYPQGILPPNTESAYLLMKTDVAANCSYSSTPGKAYGQMTPFTFNGLGTDKNGYASQVTNLPKNEQVNYYVKCMSLQGMITPEDHVISFSIGEVSNLNDDSLELKASLDNPDASTLIVYEDSENSDNYTVHLLGFGLGQDSSDLEVGNVFAEVTIANPFSNNDILGGQDDVIDGIFMTINGETVEGEATTDGTDGEDAVIASGSNTTVEYLFDFDQDVVLIELMGNDVYRVKISAVFEGQDGDYEDGVTIKTSVNKEGIEVEGESGELVKITGSDQDSDTHTLRSKGIVTEMTDDSAVVTVGDNSGDDYVTFEIEVEVTAFEQDVYISTDPTSSMQFSIVSGSGATVGGTTNTALSSSADDGGEFFEINEGETETLTLQVTFDADTAGASARLQLNSITFDENGTVTNADDSVHATVPASNYRTSIKTLVN